MKVCTRFFANGILLAATLYSVPSLAHDPKEHQSQSAKPDCAALKNMDSSKMDMNDPVMMALHKKCRKEMAHDELDAHHNPGAKSGESKNSMHEDAHK